MATQRKNKRQRVDPVVYQGKALQMQDSIRTSIRTLSSNKRRLFALFVSVGLLALMLAGDGMPIKHPVCRERQEWEIKSKLVVEQGLIWEVDE
jgi:hypothetical protein